MKRNCSIKLLVSIFLLPVSFLIMGQDNAHQEDLPVDRVTHEITDESLPEQTFVKTADVTFSEML
ncbi:MAG: hypothetical protein PHG06_12230, partial [Parabacteroides sp.]|nr:hypothetical protein [Parabacteroides sp.]